nr:MAG: nonstructural polyprotein [Astroviridae sp.]
MDKEIAALRVWFSKGLEYIMWIPLNTVCQLVCILFMTAVSINSVEDENEKVKRAVVTLLCVNLILFTKLPIFLVMIAMTFLPLPGFILALWIYFIDMPLVSLVFLLIYWCLSICHAIFLSAEKMKDIFLGCLYTLIIPIWYLITIAVVHFGIPVFVQILITVVVSSGAAITKWAYSLDTNKDAPRMHAPIRSAWSRILSWQRGVIPAQCDISDRIVEIETPEGCGVGFRFMNYILTAGHVVGQNKVVTLKWKGFTTQSTVKCKVAMIECPDTLVKIQLPSSFQNLKPLKVSKEMASCYGSLTVFNEQRNAVQVLQGWIIFDGYWLASAFDTRPGHSGAPYTDAAGRLIGIHLGSQGLLGAGYNLTHILSSNFDRNEEAVVETVELQNDADPDLLVRRVIAGVQTSNRQLLASLEELRERVGFLEDINFAYFGEKKRKKPLDRVRNKLRRAKVLTEEQYKQLQDKGVSMDEIKEIVNQLREAAFQEFLCDYEDDEETDYVVEEQGQLRFYESKDGVIKSAKVSGPDEFVKKTFEKVVTDEDVESGEQTRTILTTAHENTEVTDKKLKLDKIKRPEIEGANVKHVVASGDTVVVEKKGEEPIVVKRKTTTIKDEPAKEEHVVTQEKKIAVGSRLFEKRPPFNCPICEKEFTTYHDVDECAKENGYRRVEKGSKNRRAPPKKGGHQ